MSVYVLVDGVYEMQQFRGEDAIASAIFPELELMAAEILTVEDVAKAGQIQEAIHIQQQAIKDYETAYQQLVDVASRKSQCEQLETLLSRTDELSKAIMRASDAVRDIQTKFQSESTDELEQAILEASEFAENGITQYREELTRLYQKREFVKASDILNKLKSGFEKAEEELAYVSAAPSRIQGQRDELDLRLKKIRQENNSLNPRNQVDIDESAWDLLSLAILQNRISQLESSVSNASQEQRREQSSSSTSSWSSSSSSSYGSYSGGSDYGGYSGGSDYGSYSGGGDY